MLNRENTRTVVVLGLIISFCLINNIFLGLALDKIHDIVWLPGAMLGICLGQLNLISIWAAISPGSPIVRLPWAYLLVVLVWGSLVIGFRIPGHLPDEDVLLIGVVLFVFCSVAQIPLWIASRVFHWRLTSPVNDAVRTNQFKLSEMFLGTILLATTLAVCRLFFPSDIRGLGVLLDPTAHLLFLTMAVVNLVTVVPAIWAAFFRPFWRGVATWIAVFFLISVLEVVAIVLMFGPPGSSFLGVFTSLNASQIAVVYLAMKLLSRVGFGLTRDRPATGDVVECRP